MRLYKKSLIVFLVFITFYICFSIRANFKTDEQKPHILDGPADGDSYKVLKQEEGFGWVDFYIGFSFIPLIKRRPSHVLNLQFHIIFPIDYIYLKKYIFSEFLMFRLRSNFWLI